jgi:hypothetical protein
LVIVVQVYIMYTTDDSEAAAAAAASGSGSASALKASASADGSKGIGRAPFYFSGAVTAKKPGAGPPSNPLLIGSAKNGTQRRLKTILYWNEFYGRYDTYDFGYGHEAFVEKQGRGNAIAKSKHKLTPSA